MATTKKRTSTAKRTIVAKPASRATGRSASNNGARPYVGLSDAARKAQQKRLKKLGEELKAEGFDGSEYLPEIRRRAATWPE
jgi:hypothetical protein